MKAFEVLGTFVNSLDWILIWPLKLFRLRTGEEWTHEKYDKAFTGAVATTVLWGSVLIVAIVWTVVRLVS